MIVDTFTRSPKPRYFGMISYLKICHPEVICVLKCQSSSTTRLRMVEGLARDLCGTFLTLYIVFRILVVFLAAWTTYISIFRA